MKTGITPISIHKQNAQQAVWLYYSLNRLHKSSKKSSSSVTRKKRIFG